MLKEIKKIKLYLYSQYLYTTKLQLSLLQNKISLELYENEKSLILDELFEIIIKVSHIAYENNKEMTSISKNSLFAFTNKQNLHPIKFLFNYNESIKEAERILLVLSLLERDNVQFPKLESANDAIQMFDERGLLNKLNEILDLLSDETIESLSYLTNPNFQLDDLPKKDIRLFNLYHMKYMIENIYPSVTKSESREKDVLKLAKNFGDKQKRY